MKEPQDSGSLRVQPYGCSQCGSRFTRRENLKRHEDVHKAKTMNKCKFCPKTFVRKDLVLRHQRHVHKLELHSENDSQPAVPKEERTEPETTENTKLVTAIQTLSSSESIPRLLPFQSMPEMTGTGSNYGAVVLPPFDSEDLQRKYDPRLHHYFTLRPFYPPEFFEHYIDLFFDNFHTMIPLLHRESFDACVTSASHLRSIASLGCFTMGIESDEEMGKEIWHSGLSVLQLYLQDDMDKHKLLWVCQAICLYSYGGLFMRDSSMLQRVLAHIPALSRTIRDQGWHKIDWTSYPNLSRRELMIEVEGKRRLVFAFYILGVLSALFNQGSAWLTFSEITTFTPDEESYAQQEGGDQGIALFNLAENVRQLKTKAIEFEELELTALSLICVIHESMMSLTVVRQIFNSSDNSEIRALENVLHNLSDSVRYRSSSKANDLPHKNLDLFWVLWHLAHWRLQYFFCPVVTSMMNFGHGGLSDVISSMRFSEKMLRDTVISDHCDGSCLDHFVKMKPAIQWFTRRLSDKELMASDSPMARLGLNKIALVVLHAAEIYDNQLLEYAARTNTDNFTMNTAREMFALIAPGITSKSLASRLIARALKVLEEPGAWNLQFSVGGER